MQHNTTPFRLFWGYTSDLLGVVSNFPMGDRQTHCTIDRTPSKSYDNLVLRCLSCSVGTSRKGPGNERNLKIAFKTIGLFRVAPSLCFKARLSVKPLICRSCFILMQMNLIFTRNILHVALFWQWEFLALGNCLLIWAVFSCSEAIKQEVYIVTRASGSYGCVFP